MSDVYIFLQRLNTLDLLIENKVEEVKQAESVAMCTGATNSGERVQASGNQHKMEYAV